MLQLALSGALIAVSGYAADKTGRACVRARQLGERLGDTQGLLRALSGEFVHHHVRGEMDRSHRAAKELLSSAEREGDISGQITGHRAVGDGLLHLGQLAAARAHLERAVTLSDTVDPRALTFLLAENVRVASLSFLSLTLAIMGFPDQAVARNEQALEEARGLSHATSTAFALSTACRVHNVLGNIRIVLRLTEELIALASEQQFAFFEATGHVYRGVALIEAGELATGLELLQSGTASFKKTGATFLLPLFLGWLSAAYVQMDQPEEGLTQLSTALDLSKATGVRWYDAELQRRKGELLLTSRTRSEVEAEKQFGDAIAFARQQGAKLFELRASVGLAHLWSRQDKRTDARDLLAPICAWFTEGLTMADLQEARELLATLDA